MMICLLCSAVALFLWVVNREGRSHRIEMMILASQRGSCDHWSGDLKRVDHIYVVKNKRDMVKCGNRRSQNLFRRDTRRTFIPNSFSGIPSKFDQIPQQSLEVRDFSMGNLLWQSSFLWPLSWKKLFFLISESNLICHNKVPFLLLLSTTKKSLSFSSLHPPISQLKKTIPLPLSVMSSMS